MDWFVQIMLGILGGVMLYYGAEFLVKGGVSIALKFKITPLVIGLTLVAFATSAPELAVSISASLKGSGDVAMGNVVGSNICNIALILGLSALIAPLPVNKKLLKLDMPLMFVASLLLTGCFLLNHGVNRWQGAIFFLGILAYTFWSIYSSRKEGVSEDDGGDEVEIKEVNLWLSIAFVVGGLLTLVYGARFFVGSASFIALKLGVPEAIIGLTIVAFGTSLPELATSIVAALKKEQDIAIGNVVGSNIFNILCIMGISPMIKPISAKGISLIDFGVMIGIAVLLWGMMIWGKKINRTAGVVFLIVNFAYVGWLISRSIN
ncbi:MAG: calcium/sodium antiporter [Lentisphaerae bacterium]|nr:calcium/sodium antiporter [Lentisphaerota bacterium]